MPTSGVKLQRALCRRLPPLPTAAVAAAWRRVWARLRGSLKELTVSCALHSVQNSKSQNGRARAQARGGRRAQRAGVPCRRPQTPHISLLLATNARQPCCPVDLCSSAPWCWQWVSEGARGCTGPAPPAAACPRRGRPWTGLAGHWQGWQGNLAAQGLRVAARRAPAPRVVLSQGWAVGRPRAAQGLCRLLGARAGPEGCTATSAPK